jgi:hypothetical protein
MAATIIADARLDDGTVFVREAVALLRARAAAAGDVRRLARIDRRPAGGRCRGAARRSQ